MIKYGIEADEIKMYKIMLWCDKNKVSVSDFLVSIATFTIDSATTIAPITDEELATYIAEQKQFVIDNTTVEIKCVPNKEFFETATNIREVK